MAVDAVDRAPQAADVISLVPAVMALGAVALAAARVTRPQCRRLVMASSEPQGSRIQALGRYTRRAVGRDPDAALDRALGWAIVIALPVACVQITLGVVVFLMLRSVSVLRRRRVASQQVARVGDGLADVIDLFAVALLSGSTVGVALGQVADWADLDYAEAFTGCARDVAHGRALSDALELLPLRVGPQIRPLVAALVATERHGAPVAQNLSQLAADSRADRRRRAEAVARRLPVAMLFPLVVCVLPAFLLVTVVPVIAETLDAFSFAASP